VWDVGRTPGVENFRPDVLFPRAVPEQVVHCHLSRPSRLLRTLRFNAHDLNLVPTQTMYRRHRNGPKQALRFTKTGDPNLEAAYARHFVWPGRHGFGASTPVEAAVDVDEIPHLPPPLHSKP
jgi:hypothetical protein